MQKSRSYLAMKHLPRTADGTGYQHQVRNLMATIRVIAARTAENATDLEDFTAHFDGRLAALARAQQMLTRAGTFEIDLEELIREELLSHGASAAVVEGPGVLLSQKAAETLALALHELATNAVKFGALGDGGRLAIRWHIADGMLVLDWRETSVAALDPNPKRFGFGREWIEQGLPYQLEAQTQLEFLPGGVTCTIRIPLRWIAGQGGAS